MADVNAGVIVAALDALLEVARDGKLMPSTRLSIVKSRATSLRLQVDQQARESATPDRVLHLLRQFVHDDDPCQWDHNHSCQAHGFFYIPQGEKCPAQEAKDLLASGVLAVPADQIRAEFADLLANGLQSDIVFPADHPAKEGYNAAVTVIIGSLQEMALEFRKAAGV